MWKLFVCVSCEVENLSGVGHWENSWQSKEQKRAKLSSSPFHPQSSFRELSCQKTTSKTAQAPWGFLSATCWALLSILIFTNNIIFSTNILQRVQWIGQLGTALGLLISSSIIRWEYRADKNRYLPISVTFQLAAKNLPNHQNKDDKSANSLLQSRPYS